MKTIQKILSTMRNAQTAGLCQEILLEFPEELLEVDAKLKKIISFVIALQPQLIEALNREKAKSNLKELDDKRDATYKAIQNLVSALFMHPNPSIVEAAKLVHAVTSKYGSKLTREGYSPESALLQSYLNDMKRPEIAKSIAVLPGMDGLLSALEAQEVNFSSSQQVLNDAIVAVEMKKNATVLKRELINELNTKLIPYLRINQALEEPEYANICIAVGQKINDANVIVKQNRGKK